MKKYYLLSLLLFCFIGFSQPIAVNTTQYTVPQLVTEVLINTPCAEISNITWKTGITDNSFANGIGYFSNSNPNFPMANGIVLSTMPASQTPGPPGSTISPSSWTGDQQLFNYMTALGIDPNLNVYNDASIIEFDFLPFTDKMSFNFLFASNEYGYYQCSFSDAFAFFLTNSDTGEVTNLALVPNTTSPISVITIRDEQYNTGPTPCTSENPEYFGSYDEGNPSGPINFNGRTVKMVASSEVTPGVQYRIKLVVANRNDHTLDSAVFIEGGSFDIGQPNLGENRLIEDGSAMCDGEEYQLSTGLNPEQYLFQWTRNGAPIPGATDFKYVVTEPGLYGVLITAVQGSCEQDPIPVLIEFFDEIQIDNPPLNLELCPTAGGTTGFDLKDSQVGVTTDPVIFTYFLTEANALANSGAIPSLYSMDNSINTPVTIWVRIMGLTLPCSRVESFTLSFVSCNIVLNNLPDMSVCLGIQPNSFDLLPYKDLVYFGAIGYTTTFYHSEADALAQVSAIDESLLSDYVATNGETIWVRVQDDSDQEVYGIQSFKLYLYDLPVVNTPQPLRSCELSSSGLATFDLTLNQVAIVGTQTGITLDYYPTYAEAEIGNSAFSLPSIYVGPEGSLFIRVTNQNTGCYIIVEQPLEVIDQPGATPIAPLQICSASNDGYGVFNLLPTAILIAGNPIPAGLQVTYHETIQDANNNVNKIVATSGYHNIVANSQTIYVRVGYLNSICASVVPLQLIVNRTPEIISPTPLQVCDTNNDSVANFDLTSKTSEILNGLNPALYLVTFHSTDQNAESGTNAIANPTIYSNLTSSIVFVRVENISTGCHRVVRLFLQANPTPVVAKPIPTYQLCDDGFDGFEKFDLASKVPSIVGNQTGLAVTFHYTNADALSGSNPLASPYQNVVQNVQTLFVRVEKVNTGCFTISTMDIRVNPLPVLNIPANPFEICSNTDTSFGTVDLTSFNSQLLNGGPAYELKYFETQANAQNNVFPIVSPTAYNNLEPVNPSVWVRATNLVTGCSAVYKVNFKLLVSPKMPVSLPEIITCDVHGNLFDGITPFNLTQQTPLILNAQTIPGNYVVRYFTTQALANAGNNWIANPEAYINSVNPQVIWVRVHNAAHPNSCFEIKSFTIKANVPLFLGQPAPIVLCDNALPNDEQNVFDLTIRANQITQGEVFGATLTYYLNEAEAKAGINEIFNPTTYTNISNPQTIWVAVENMHGCKSYTTLTIRVLPLPEPNLNPTPLKMCENQLGSSVALFDLTSSQLDMSNGNTTLSYAYFLTEQQARNNTGAITTANNFLTNSITVYVRVSNNPTISTESCFVIVPLQLIVNPLPNIGPLTTLFACKLNSDGRFTFDLTSKNAQVLGNQDPANFTVRYYLTQDLANEGLSPLSNTYTNVQVGAQTIWVRVQNKATGCYSIAPLNLKVEEKVFAFPPTASLVFCDTDGVNDGFGAANITRLNTGIISTQNLTDDLDVRYYTSWANYAAGISSNGTAFQITSNPQLVIAEVYNTTPGSLCTATVDFYITMSKAPSFDTIPNGYVCPDFRTGIVQGYTMDTNLPAAGHTFTWMYGTDILTATGPSYTATAAGTYVVTVTSIATGCSYSQTIVVLAAPAITIDKVNITDGFSDTSAIEILASSLDTTNLEYALDEGAYQDSEFFLDVSPGQHTVWVKVKGINACAISKVINVLNYPKFFTPNGDGYNDTWNIFALKEQPEAKIYIFDRQGKLLKQLSPAGVGWDGTFNGKPLPSSDYWFKAEYIEPNTGLQKEATGHFTLKR